VYDVQTADERAEATQIAGTGNGTRQGRAIAMNGSAEALNEAVAACRRALYSDGAARAVRDFLAGRAPACDAAARRPPFNFLPNPQFARTDFAAYSRALQRDGLPVLQRKIPLDRPEAWADHEKSVAVRMHSFEPATYIAQHWYLTGDPAALDFLLTCAERWTALKARDAEQAEDLAALRACAGARPLDDFAWYDTSIPARTAVFAYVAAQDAPRARELRPQLVRAVVADLALLFERDLFRTHNNHGLFQALALLATVKSLSPLLGIDGCVQPFAELAVTMIESQFFPSGTHREHSAGYHFSILATIYNAIASGLLEGPRLDRLLAAAETAMVLFIKPDFTIATVGDTDPQAISLNDAELAPVRDPHLRYLFSRGRCGAEPPRGLRHIEDAGYVGHRGAFRPAGIAARTGRSYFLQQGGFHGLTHKHCDDLSLIWYDRDREILTDAGRYGYRGSTPPRSELRRLGFFYSDPKRIFCELPRAHNAVEFDSLPYDRREPPTGNQIRFARELAGIVATEGLRRHAAGVEHRRIVLFAPGQWLVVIDGLRDLAGRPRRYRQFFQLAAPWTPFAGGSEWQGGDERLFVSRFSRHGWRGFHALGRTRPWLGWTSGGAWMLKPSQTLWSRVGPVPATVLLTAFAFDTPLGLAPGATLHSDDLAELDLTITSDNDELRVRRSRDGELDIRALSG